MTAAMLSFAVLCYVLIIAVAVGLVMGGWRNDGTRESRANRMDQ